MLFDAAAPVKIIGEYRILRRKIEFVHRCLHETKSVLIFDNFQPDVFDAPALQ